MKEICAFEASDGTQFLDKKACQEYESALPWHSNIDAFMESGFCPYTKGPHEVMARKTIIAWEQYNAKNRLNK